VSRRENQKTIPPTLGNWGQWSKTEEGGLEGGLRFGNLAVGCPWAPCPDKANFWLNRYWRV